jgi:predicted amidohydrolase
MNICLAQMKSEKGDIETNISKHIKFIDLAIKHNSDIIIFPELSLTAYEPSLAKKLAMRIDDSRLNCFQDRSNNENIIICLGAPVIGKSGVLIGMIILQPNKKRELYSKQYLHPDELDYFTVEKDSNLFMVKNNLVSFAICYELSVAEHSETAHKSGSKIYITSGAKTKDGMGTARENMSDISKKYGMTSIMVNSVGEADGNICYGQSTVWGENGMSLVQLEAEREGLIIFNYLKKNFIEEYFL